MSEQIQNAPFTFWLQLLVLVGLLVEAIRKRHLPWALPLFAVYGTVSFWYTADYLLSRPAEFQWFTPEVVSFGFLQITLFLLCFRAFVGWFSVKLIPRNLRSNGGLDLSDSRRIVEKIPRKFLGNFLVLLVLGWLGILAFGVSFAGDAWPALIWPPLRSEKISMYPLTRVGGGASFLYNAIGYVHLLICAMFGVVATLARGPLRWTAATFALLSWPYFWFDRTRSKMLALLLPGLASFLLFGTRSQFVRIVVLSIVGGGIILWFARVMEFRSEGSVAAFLESEETDPDSSQDQPGSRNAAFTGQDMFEELCWINTYLVTDRYRPNWGARYLAELLNPIPRALWPDKPMIGIDYSILRGFASSRGDAGVRATISTGMIGQGCVNFGRYLGVVAAAILFALWATFLARLWCQREEPLRAFLFLIGLGLTFNTGRDLTFLVLFPFVFGYLGVRVHEFLRGPKHDSSPRTRIRTGSGTLPPR